MRVLLRTSAAALSAVALAACSAQAPSTSTADPTTAPGSYRLSKECPGSATLQPVSADIVNKVVSATTLPAWQAGDIGTSAKLSDNRLAWVFGDTIRDASHHPRIVSNSLLVSSGLCISQVLAPQDAAIVPDIDETHAYWPMSMVRLDPAKVQAPKITEASDILVVLVGRIKRGKQNAFDFTYLGSSVAVFSVKKGESPQPLGIEQITPDSTSATQINWGSAAMVDGPWYYVYGSRSTGKKYEFGRELYVARVPIAHPAEQDRWQVWDGSTWQADPAKAKAVLPASEGVSQTLTVSKVKDKYVVVSKKGGDLGDFVYTWTSNSPTGPWTGRQGIKAPFGLDQGELEYAPLGHPEIPLRSGKLLVSVSRNTTDLTKLLNEPSAVGRPRFAEVQLPDL